MNNIYKNIIPIIPNTKIKNTKVKKPAISPFKIFLIIFYPPLTF